MKDSAMILVVAAIVAAAALPGIATSLVRMERATETIEQVRSAARAPSGLRAMTSSNRVARLHCIGKTWRSL
jgi:type II secretory pathway pseudopilin PulG